MTIPNVDTSALTALSPNLEMDEVADPALRLAAFQYIYEELAVIVAELNSIPTANIQNQSITAGKIADLAIITAKYADLSVTTSKLAEASVTLSKMAANSVGTSQLVDLGVTRAKIALQSIGSGQLDPSLLTNFGDIAVQAEFDRRGVNPMKFGAKGDGVTNDTVALRTAITQSIALGKSLLLPPGNYKVTENIFSVSIATSGLVIIGSGTALSIISFEPTDSDEICIDLAFMSRSLLKDFSIFNSETKGVGINLGRLGVVGSDTYNNDFINIYCRGLDIGIYTTPLLSYINSFVNLKTRFCNKGMITNGGGVSFTAYVCEANIEYGIKIAGGTVSFNGFVIEMNDIGMIIEAGNVTMNNAYFEENPNGNIIAGEGSATVDSIIINGLYTTYYEKYVFDKVQYLEINGVTGALLNDFRISTNVKIANIQESKLMADAKIFVQGNNSASRRAVPLVVNDLSRETAYVNGGYLDKVSQSMTIFQNESTGSFTTLDGKNVYKFVITAAKTFAGFRISMNLLNVYLKRYSKIKLKSKLYIDSSTFPSMSAAKLYSTIILSYRDNVAALKQYNLPYSFTNGTEVGNQYGFRDNHISMIYDFDFPSIVSAIPDFVSLETLNVYLSVITSPASVGGETVYFRGFELYPEIDVKDILSDWFMPISDFNIPVAVSPDGTRHRILISDANVITATTVT